MYKEEYESYTEPWQLKKLRESYGVSVNQLAQVYHVSFETIKRIEHTSKHENIGGGITRYKPQTYQEEKNKTYTVVIDPDGNKHYVCEFDVVLVRHIRKELSREEFLKEV